MSDIPNNLKYHKTHEWVSGPDDGVVTIGITDHAQEQLGDLVFVELPEVGTTISVEGECPVVESVKAASDIYIPLSGEVVEANELLADAPETINDDPYGEGWIFKLRLSDEGELDSLLSADEYSKVTEEE
jgi:glycine cleavage system H protein